MSWYYILCVLCERNVKPQARSFWCAKCETKTNLSIRKLEALTLTTYSPNIYNIFTSLKLLYIYIYTHTHIKLQTALDTGFKLKFFMQLTKQIFWYLIEILLKNIDTGDLAGFFMHLQMTKRYGRNKKYAQSNMLY